MEYRCANCGDSLTGSNYIKPDRDDYLGRVQRYCGKQDCQNARRAAWRREQRARLKAPPPPPHEEDQ